MTILLILYYHYVPPTYDKLQIRYRKTTAACLGVNGGDGGDDDLCNLKTCCCAPKTAKTRTCCGADKRE